ncbi:unnamed protein product [Closterium sp. NIES-53]
MASPTLLTFDAEGRAVAFDVWLDDLQLFLQCDSKDGLSLFDLTSGASTAPAADADSTVRSQWLTRGAAARLAVRSHLPPTERAHFSQYKSAKTLYDAVVARYSSPATTALSRLMLPYLFPDLAAFATVTNLITHLRTSDTHYHTALPAESGVAIFDLDFDAILSAMYAVSISDEGDYYVCVPPDPGIEVAALGARESAAPGTRESATPGAGESALSGTASAQVFQTFTLDSSASSSFFRDRTTLTPLSQPIAVSLEDPSVGPVLARYSTDLPCPAASSGSLSGLYLPSFSTNLVSGADLQDAGVDQFTPAGQRVTHCTCAQTGRHLATFTRRPGSSLYTLTTDSPPVAASGQVAASSQVFAAASRSGPEFAPCSCRLLSHQTLLWHDRLGHPSLPRLRGKASRVLGHERYFLLVVDDYSHYTTVFPLRSKGEVTEVLIDWIRVARLQLRERFGSDFPVLRLHSDRGGEFSSDLLRAFCRAEGICKTFTLPASPQQNGIAERRIGMVMDVAPFVRDLSANKLSSRAVPCVFLGFPPDAPGWQFYHPTSRRVLSSQDVTFD